MAAVRMSSALVLLCLCLGASSALSATVRRSPSPILAVKRRSPSPKPAGKTVPLCFWKGNTCYVEPFRYLSTQFPAPSHPYTYKLVSTIAKDYDCWAYKTKAACNAATAGTCLWDSGWCQYALKDNIACPASRLTAFLGCDYYNTVAAKPAVCKAAKCGWDAARGCYHPTFATWTAAALKTFRDQSVSGELDLPYYGCCSSYIAYDNTYPPLCFGLTTKAKCTAAAAADCVWLGNACSLSDAAIYRAELEALSTANTPFGNAHVAADAECSSFKSKATCSKKTAPLDTARLARYRKPWKEAALDPKKYCSTSVLGP